MALRRALPEQVKEELRTFWENVEFASSQNTLAAFLRDRALSHRLESPQLAYLGYSVRLLFGEEQYRAFVSEIEREEVRRVQQEVAGMVSDTLTDMVFDAASAFLPGIRIGMRVGKLVLRKVQEKRRQES